MIEFIDSIYFFIEILWVVLLGGCIGSFSKVAIDRLLNGESLMFPKSACPVCKSHLRIFCENLPLFGWFVLRGRCRFCKAPIPLLYFLYELFFSIFGLFLYATLYVFPRTGGFFSSQWAQWWTVQGLWGSFPAFLALFIMLSLIGVSVIIDARTYLVPIVLTFIVCASGLLGSVCQPFFLKANNPVESWYFWYLPKVDGLMLVALFGMALGLLCSFLLLQQGVLKQSFADYEDYLDEGESIAFYPHARREMFWEFLYLLPVFLGGLAALIFVSPNWFNSEIYQSLGGSLAGIFVGGGVIWGVRILGTLAFGREAMGLGDVHLMAGIGAVLGWVDALIVFFMAPFFGLFWVLISSIIGKVKNQKLREIPYGPHLAIAAFVVVFLRGPVEQGLLFLYPDFQFDSERIIKDVNQGQIESIKGVELVFKENE